MSVVKTCETLSFSSISCVLLFSVFGAVIFVSQLSLLVATSESLVSALVSLSGGILIVFAFHILFVHWAGSSHQSAIKRRAFSE